MSENQKLPLGSKLIDKTFYFPVHVYYEDTDAGGIVYYANYLKFAERARSEFLYYLGIRQKQILQDKNAGFVVRSCNIEYLKSAVLEDELMVSCSLKKLGAASAEVEQKIYCNEELLTLINVKLINLDIATHKPTKIAPQLRSKLSELL